MAKWLQCQEAIDLRTAYLQWHAGLPPQDETDEDVADDEDTGDVEDAISEVNDQVTAKTPM